jgi:hypothetical protein
MKSKLILLVLLAFSTTLSFAQVKQDRSVANFSAIEVSGAFKVFIRMGDKCALTVIANEDALDDIKSSVDNGVLEVEMDSDWWDGSNSNEKLELYITVTSLKEIDLSGACSLESKNTMSGENLLLDLSGASKVELELNFATVTLDVSGAAKCNLSGKSNKLIVDASGASAIYAADLQTNIVNIDASGACKAEVAAANVLNVDASGACKVLYKGNPKITKDVSGAASVSEK